MHRAWSEFLRQQSKPTFDQLTDVFYILIHEGSSYIGCLRSKVRNEDSKMREDYKGHAIHSTASFLPDGWKPHVYIAFNDGGLDFLKNFTIDRTFATSEKAEQAGLSFAQKWIDDGRPDLDLDQFPLGAPLAPLSTKTLTTRKF
jgi:hypothetical protein